MQRRRCGGNFDTLLKVLDAQRTECALALTFSGVVYSHQAGTSVGLLVQQLKLLAKCVEAEEFQNQVFYLPLR